MFCVKNVKIANTNLEKIVMLLKKDSFGNLKGFFFVSWSLEGSGN